MYQLSAHCICKKISIEIILAKEPSQYEPRACDCEFCLLYNAKYVSDPVGKMKIVLSEKGILKRQKQGSGTADFNLCAGCGSFLAVTFQENGKFFGAVNASLFPDPNLFGHPVFVSPKKLDVTAKTNRWREVWFPNVQIQGL